MNNHVINSILLVTLAILASCADAFSQPAVVDLTRWNFANSDVYPMSGNWEFYTSKLLTPLDFIKSNQRPEVIWVPGSWNRQLNYPSLGFATYRIRMKLPGKNGGLAIYFPIINSSARIWVNGEKAAETGFVSADENLYKPKLAGTLVGIPSNTVDLDVIVQVVNYTHFNGGMTSMPELGKISALLSRINTTQSIENFFAGSLMAMFIYQFILYFLYRRGKPYLWLSLICLGVALRAMIVHGGSFMLPNLFPMVSWEIWKKIEFGCVYSIVALFPVYIFHLFRESAPPWPIKFFIVVSALLCIAVVVTPQHIYGRLLDIAHLALLLTFLYAIYSVGRAWKSGNKDAKIILLGVLASFPFILTEILKNTLLFPLDIQLRYLVEMGVLIFLLFQVYLLANHFAQSFKSLESLNQNLERIVDERSSQLVIANQVKDRLLSIMSHDIKSPLNSLRGILHIYNTGAISPEEFKTYAKHLEGDLTKTTLLVENVLYWTTGQLKGVKVKLGKFSLKDALNENIELFQTMLSNKHITMENTLNEDHCVHFDRDILNLSLRNVISNAIKFSFDGGKIIVRCKQTGDHAVIQVIDGGLGMTQETIESLQSAKTTKSALGTADEKGTGLGLTFCREYLHIAGGHLKIESALGEGSTFSIWIPKTLESEMILAAIHEGC